MRYTRRNHTLRSIYENFRQLEKAEPNINMHLRYLPIVDSYL